MTDEPPKDPPQPGVPDAAPSLETGPTADPREPGAPTVEVAPDVFEAEPAQPSRRAQAIAAQPDEAMPVAPMPGEPMSVDPTSVEYVPAPVPFDAPTQPTGPAVDAAAAADAMRATDTPAAPADDAILPTALDDNALREAVGAPPARPRRTPRPPADDDDAPARPGNRRVIVLAAIGLLLALGIGAFVLLGRVNAQRYVIACTTDQVSAEQGRSFPPWGTRPLIGSEWKPITLPANAECRPRETDDRGELEGWFLTLLIDRASTTLTARDLIDSIQPGKTNPLDVVADQLNQALLLSRAPERRDQRKEVERLLGDVQYWRASLRLRDAAAALADAARQYDAAAAQRPRHATDAGAWAAFLRGIVDHLHAGPGGVPAVTAPTGEPISERPSAPAGTALPVEPEGTSSAASDEAEPAAPPDAGLPTGGVLL